MRAERKKNRKKGERERDRNPSPKSARCHGRIMARSWWSGPEITPRRLHDNHLDIAPAYVLHPNSVQVHAANTQDQIIGIQPATAVDAMGRSRPYRPQSLPLSLIVYACRCMSRMGNVEKPDWTIHFIKKTLYL